MPFLHLDARNLHKDAWKELVKNHPAQFEVLEWTTEQDRDLLLRTYPAIDTQLFPRSCVSIAANLQKLVDYGGIAVRGEDIAPIRGLRIMLEDWKTLGGPRKLTVRGYARPIFVDKTTIMVSEAQDPVAMKYRDLVMQMMLSGTWEHPIFENDVAII